jgi:alpha-dioxygenase
VLSAREANVPFLAASNAPACCDTCSTPDASGNDPKHPSTGTAGAPFGRNMPSVPAADRNPGQAPSVQLVAEKLLARKQFKPAGDQLNVLAAVWIQAMTHDWMGHADSEDSVELSEGGAQCPLKAFRFKKTRVRPDGAYANSRTHYWDASFLYGQTAEAVMRARTKRDGKLHESPVLGLLPLAGDGTPLVGDGKNSWVGVSLLQELFLREHNLVAETIAREHPELSGEDEKLFNYSRLVISAIVAKIHTVDWTVALLDTPLLKFSMNANWFGASHALGVSKSGPPGLLGLVGQGQIATHGVPFALTEEFVAVYRMHPMLPDGLIVPDRRTIVPLEGLVGPSGEAYLREKESAPVDLWGSIVRYPCGNLQLFNYPRALRDLAPTDELGRAMPDRVDLAALDLYRDRERGILKFNDFRRAIHLKPFRDYDDMTGGDEEAVKALTEVYGADNIEAVDLLVGNLAEKKIEGFAISETSFLIFILMASRRLEADRFFTVDFNEAAYTRTGFAWVRNVTSMRDVLAHHFPDVAAAVPAGASAFEPFATWPDSTM